MAQTISLAKRYFIPNPDNNHRPKILEPHIVRFICLVALVAELGFVLSATYVIPRSRLFGIVVANTLVDETNAARQANGLPALTVNPLLQQAAQEKANDMVTNNYFAHTSPSGLTPWYWFEQVGYSFDYAGENLAVNFSDSADVTSAWMNSPDHRANILSGNFTQIGIATAQGTYNGQSSTYVVELFGTPAPVAPAPFVNSASAASIPAATTAPATQPVLQTKIATTTTPSKTTTASSAKTGGTSAKAVPAKSAPAPVVVASTSVEDSSSQQLFVAVKGASTEATSVVPAATTPVAASTTTPASAGTTGAGDADATQNAGAPQSNIVQSAFANPTLVENDLFLGLIILFVIALGLNIFIRIRIQHPTLIMSGATVIAIAAVCIVLNQNLSLLHAAIL